MENFDRKQLGAFNLNVSLERFKLANNASGKQTATFLSYKRELKIYKLIECDSIESEGDLSLLRYLSMRYRKARRTHSNPHTNNKHDLNADFLYGSPLQIDSAIKRKRIDGFSTSNRKVVGPCARSRLVCRGHHQ